MNKLTLFLEEGKSTVYLERFINTKYGDKMKVNNVNVFWKFKNVKKDVNDTVTVGFDQVTFREGYWTFYMIDEKLGEKGVKLGRNRYDNTCKFFSKNNVVNLKNLAPLLGFPKNKVIITNSRTESPSTVDVNLGRRFVTIECGSVDSDKKFE